MKRLLVTALALPVALLAACSSTPAQVPASAPASPVAQAQAPATLKIGDTWSTPAADLVITVSRATRTVTKEDGTDAPLVYAALKTHVTNKSQVPIGPSSVNMIPYMDGKNWLAALGADSRPEILPGQSGDWTEPYEQPDHPVQVQIQAYVTDDGSAIVDGDPANIPHAIFTGTYDGK